MSDSDLKAYIGNIQHCNVHDGNGFRTTVFFQGCGMRCKWCQNPELQPIKPIDVRVDTDNLYEKSSRLMTVVEVFEECLKEESFFKYHSGGVTLSGGEPMLHKEYCLKLLQELKGRNINTAVETAGYVPFETIEVIYKYVDTFLYDVKLISEDKRKLWLGIEDELDLENLKRLSLIHNKIVIRIPLIPDVNDINEEFNKIVDFISEIEGIEYIHILPFHQLGAEKYKRIGVKYEMENVPLNDVDRLINCKKLLEEKGYKVDVGGKGFTYL